MKTRISRTARQLFLEQGIEGVSMRNIAGAVDVSATAIYRHFRDKNELLEEITEEGFGIFRRYMNGALEADTPLECLHGMAQRYLDFALEHPRHYDFIFSVPRENVRTFPRDFSRPNDLNFHILSEQVELAMRAGQLVEADPLEAALSIWAQAHGLVALQRAGRFSQDETEIRAVYTRSMNRLLEGMTP